MTRYEPTTRDSGPVKPGTRWQESEDTDVTDPAWTMSERILLMSVVAIFVLVGVLWIATSGVGDYIDATYVEGDQ